MSDQPLLSRLDLNLLVALDALLTERSVTRAAERLHLSQPALSASLARLRTHFNDPILARRGNTYELTPLAIRLTEHTTTALEAARRVFESQATLEPADSTREFSVYGSDYGFATIGTARLEARGRARTRRPLPVHAAQPRDRRRGLDAAAGRSTACSSRTATSRDLPYVDLWRDGWVILASESNEAIGDELTMEHPRRSCPGSSPTRRARRSPRRRGSCSSWASSRASRPSWRASCRCRTSSAGTNRLGLLQAGLAPLAKQVGGIRVLPRRSMPPPSSTRSGGIRCTTATPEHAWMRGDLRRGRGAGGRRPRRRRHALRGGYYAGLIRVSRDSQPRSVRPAAARRRSPRPCAAAAGGRPRAGARRMSRVALVDTLIAATTAPSRACSGAAIERSPGSSSPSTSDQPCSRTRASSARRAAGSVSVRSVRRARSDAASSGSARHRADRPAARAPCWSRRPGTACRS